MKPGQKSFLHSSWCSRWSTITIYNLEQEINAAMLILHTHQQIGGSHCCGLSTDGGSNGQPHIRNINDLNKKFIIFGTNFDAFRLFGHTNKNKNKYIFYRSKTMSNELIKTMRINMLRANAGEQERCKAIHFPPAAEFMYERITHFNLELAG